MIYIIFKEYNLILNLNAVKQLQNSQSLYADRIATKWKSLLGTECYSTLGEFNKTGFEISRILDWGIIKPHIKIPIEGASIKHNYLWSSKFRKNIIILNGYTWVQTFHNPICSCNVFC